MGFGVRLLWKGFGGDRIGIRVRVSDGSDFGLALAEVAVEEEECDYGTQYER